MLSSFLRHLGLAAATVALFSFPGVAPRAAPLESSNGYSVGPQYDTAHVYVAPRDVDGFASSFLSTFGGRSTPQVTVTVTPTPSSTSSQLLQTPVGTVSLFGFNSPIPYPFGHERTGYLVTDIGRAVEAARAAGAAVIVEPFSDPIGKDAVIQWPGGVNMQLYWHFKAPSYPAFETVPENRVYVPPDKADEFVQHWLAYSLGRVVSDSKNTGGVEIGRPADHYRRVRIESGYGRMAVIVTDGKLPFPYGHETTGYEVADLAATLERAKAAGVEILDGPYANDGRDIAMVRFPGGYIAEVHATSHR